MVIILKMKSFKFTKTNQLDAIFRVNVEFDRVRKDKVRWVPILTALLQSVTDRHSEVFSAERVLANVCRKEIKNM